MAVAATAASGTLSLWGARLLDLPKGLTIARSFSASPCSMGFHHLHLGSPVLARKLVVRAARTESKGVSLGFRAPHFELPEPLTGKTWKLEEFESYPALLVKAISLVLCIWYLVEMWDLSWFSQSAAGLITNWQGSIYKKQNEIVWGAIFLITSWGFEGMYL